MEKKAISMLKTILATILIILAIVFIYPIETIVATIETIILSDVYTSQSDCLISFNKVKVKEYEKCEELGSEPYGICEAIYFNEEQANKIEIQIKNDENWTTKPFKENHIDDYKRFNIIELGKCYYYLIQFDRDGRIIETNREVLDNKGLEWYESAIYDSDNKILYYYYRHYEK